MIPKDTYEVLEQLESYHRLRKANYLNLAAKSTDPRTGILVNRLAELEDTAITVICDERSRLDPKHSTYLPTGVALESDPAHASNCRCGENPAFDDALGCALESDEDLNNLIDELADSSAAASVQDLATRLREFEDTRERQIANFARED